MVNLFAARLGRPPRRAEGTALPPPADTRAGGPRLVELALYRSSAAENFHGLRSRETISCLAALGLVASIILLWSRFPHYIHAMQVKQQAELAHNVQADLLLAPDSAFYDLKFAAACVPAWHVGGELCVIESIEELCAKLQRRILGQPSNGS